jgi:hypothetical protein
MTSSAKRRWLAPAAILFLGFVLTMLGASAYFMSSWTMVKSMAPAQAAEEFATVRAVAGGDTPYVEILPTGSVKIHHEQEGDRRTPLKVLHVLAWDHERGRLVQVDLPYWFVRLKMSEHMNLGTLTTSLAGDWEHLDLRISERELELCGPGLLLDESSPGGSRLLLWTE